MSAEKKDVNFKWNKLFMEIVNDSEYIKKSHIQRKMGCSNKIMKSSFDWALENRYITYSKKIQKPCRRKEIWKYAKITSKGVEQLNLMKDEMWDERV